MLLKKIIKKYKKELFFLWIILFGLFALSSQFNQLAISIIISGTLVYLYAKYKDKTPDEIKQLKQTLKNQHHEIEELKNRKLNIIGLKNILEISLVEVDTTFTRTWNEKFTVEKKSLHFIGALQIQLVAKYGVNLKDLIIRIDHSNKTIYINNLEPKFLSFSQINHHWKIAELMEYKKRPWIINNYWKKSQDFQELLNEKLEEKRKQLYDEIKQGPEEIKWLIKPLHQQVENTMRILLNRNDYDIEFVETDSKDFLPIHTFFEEPLLKEKNTNK